MTRIACDVGTVHSWINQWRWYIRHLTKLKAEGLAMAVSLRLGWFTWGRAG